MNELVSEQALAWIAVVRAFETGDAVDVAREVQRQIDRLYLLVQEREDAREHLRRELAQGEPWMGSPW